MTGLDLGLDKLIEIAVLVTDAELNVLGDGVDVVIHADDAALSSMIDVVAQMHTRSGLIEEVRASTVDVPTAEAMVLDYIREHVKQPKTAPLAGNSIATDRGFIARDMPALDSFLHYRMIDVSSIKELCRRWYPRVYYAKPEKGLAHRALADIEEALRELRYYARGIHPAILTDRGLDAALSSVSSRCTVPVAVTVDLRARPADAIEGIAYFTVSELLQNVSKHSGASRAAADVWQVTDRLMLQVSDNGRGGASLAAGSGLAGLAERLDSVDGVLVVYSPAGGPTRITAELPWRA
jgi:oligoribonuclease